MKMILWVLISNIIIPVAKKNLNEASIIEFEKEWVSMIL